ncbi:hypothetical protein [Flavobacterium pallidum]|uniref:hypothetical protein n=1 Tax=Flavobacterium pallidum TaxID=2172098 RepID=UPI0015E82363|nr:hypothetical protein [Flavobacterium pallidum]
MKAKLLRMFVLIAILFTFTNCELVEGIFKAGVGVGVFIVLAVLAFIIYVISRFGKK